MKIAPTYIPRVEIEFGVKLLILGVSSIKPVISPKLCVTIKCRDMLYLYYYLVDFNAKIIIE